MVLPDRAAPHPDRFALCRHAAATGPHKGAVILGASLAAILPFNPAHAAPPAIAQFTLQTGMQVVVIPAHRAQSVT